MEDTAKMAMEHPLFDEYWATKRIRLENIDIPIYQTASYSQVASHIPNMYVTDADASMPIIGLSFILMAPLKPSEKLSPRINGEF